MSLVTWGGKLLLSPSGKLTLGPPADVCCCVESPTGCDTLPDVLELELSYCGHSWIFTLTYFQSQAGLKYWQTACDWTNCRGWPDDCPQGTGDGQSPQQNLISCFVFACEGDTYALSYSNSCDNESGDCEFGAGTLIGSPDSVTASPFELTWSSATPFLANVCCDTPYCAEQFVVTIRIPPL